MKRRSFLQGLVALLPLSLLGGKKPEGFQFYPAPDDMEVYGKSPAGEALIDARELSAIMNDPSGPYMQSFARAAARKFDDQIMGEIFFSQRGFKDPESWRT